MERLQRWLIQRLTRPHLPPKHLLRAMRWYPPLLFQRVIPLGASDDFLTIHVKIKRSFLNRNLNGTFFGGTILSAIDPWYGTILWRKCLEVGISLEVWVEALEARFVRATRGDLYFTCHIPSDTWLAIKQVLETEGKLRYTFPFEVYSSEGFLCVEGRQTLYLRNLVLRPRTQARLPILS
ncbi:MAG: DUF4442 domain-containing protein [Bacteroidia bacterium]